MASNKSSARRTRVPLEPQRRHGKQRVATLLEVGAAVIAEKGYEATTMAEIAERAGSPIGSLYRFFPNKEVLANALIQRYGSLVRAAFAKIDAVADPSSPEKTADALLHFIVDLKSETKAMSALLEGRSEWSARRREFRSAAIRHIAHTLKLLAPALPQSAARNVAIVLLFNMKTMSALKLKDYVARPSGAIEELRDMNRLYLANKLASLRQPSKSPERKPR